MDLRCFISVEFPDEIKKAIGEYIRKLGETRADVKWVKAENLHLTLKFLGSTPENILDDLAEKLRIATMAYSSFSIRISGSGVFPDPGHPRVIWLGIMDSENLSGLQADIDDTVSRFGFKKEERKFSPHLTIGRVRSMKNIDSLMKELATLNSIDFGKIEVKNIDLMKSELRPSGAEYSSLKKIPFKGI